MSLKSPEYVLFFSKSKSTSERLLSNFSLSPVEYHGVTFPSIENAFQAAKYRFSTNPGVWTTLAHMSPAEAKREGSKSGMWKHGAVLDVAAWTEASPHVMKTLVQRRMQTDALYRHTIETGRRDGTAFLHFERSGAKSFWGGCFPADAPRTPSAFAGKNVLGKILMGTL